MGILILAPHFDDEFFAWKATHQIKCMREFLEVDVIFITDSDDLGEVETRYQESMRFCRTHAIYPKGFLNLPDGECWKDLPWAAEIISDIIKNYDIVLIPEPNGNPDHDFVGSFFKKEAKYYYTVNYSGERDLELEEEFYKYYPSQLYNFRPAKGSGKLREI